MNAHESPKPAVATTRQVNAYRQTVKGFLHDLDPDKLELDTPEAQYKLACQERHALREKYRLADGSHESVSTWDTVDRIKMQGVNRRCAVYAERMARIAEGLPLLDARNQPHR